MLDRFFPEPYIEHDQSDKAYDHPYIINDVTPVNGFKEGIAQFYTDNHIDRHP